MITKKLPVLCVFVPFVAYTAWVIVNGGSFAEIAAAFTVNPWVGQVTVDLVVALTMVCTWIWYDARSHGRNPLPWVVATCFTGSIAPMAYLLMRPDDGSPAAS